MIHASNLTKMFGSLAALDRVSFDVHKGEVVGFLGPNGAGKSTTMRILTCFISPSSGTAKIHGHDVFESPLEVRQKLGYLPQRAPLYGEMSVWEYLRFSADMRQIDMGTFKTRLRKVVEVCGLAQVLGKDIRTLSHGYRQRVGLGQALIHDPPILILDEPTSDLDPNEKAEVINYIREIGKERTVLLSTHNLAEVEAACARAIIVSKGRVVADGTLDDIRAKAGNVRYLVTVDEKNAMTGKAPTATVVRDALAGLAKVQSVSETPSDDKAHAFELAADKESDIRPEIYRLAVEKGWILLELRRDAKTLGDVFRDLTRGESLHARGLADRDDEDEDEDEEEDDTDDEADDDGGDDEEQDDRESDAGDSKSKSGSSDKKKKD
ncbi:MAG: ATP-binding cassette domain-containing protein [Deltaproteobacteria bacterium]|nr:ATP-binding cassette domain-containing protein [Deltaproteobacteria bacterium]